MGEGYYITLIFYVIYLAHRGRIYIFLYLSLTQGENIFLSCTQGEKEDSKDGSIGDDKSEKESREKSEKDDKKKKKKADSTSWH